MDNEVRMNKHSVDSHLPDIDPPNIDKSEQAKFNALASEWWDPDGQLQTLHDINPIRCDYIQNYVDLDNKKILDVGCGGGLLTEAMALQGALVTGIDVSDSALEVADMHAKQANLNIEYLCTTVEDYSVTHTQTYDLITCMELLEHVPDPGSVITACMRLIKPGGWLFLSTVNRSLKAYLQTKIAAEYVLKLLPAGTHDYAKYIRPSELATWCRNAGFDVTDISGMSYLPYIRRCRITDKPDVNYLLCARATSDPINKQS